MVGILPISDRSQFVNINVAKSVTQNCSFGVPQGSVSDPVLYLIHHHCMQKLFIDTISKIIETTC